MDSANEMMVYEEWHRKADEVNKQLLVVEREEEEKFEEMGGVREEVVKAVMEGRERDKDEAMKVYREKEEVWRKIAARRSGLSARLSQLAKTMRGEPDLGLVPQADTATYRRKPFTAEEITSSPQPLVRPPPPTLAAQLETPLSPLSEPSLRTLYTDWATTGNLTWSEFLERYNAYDTCGAPTPPQRLLEVIKKQNARPDEKVTYNEFCLLLLRLHQRV